MALGLTLLYILAAFLGPATLFGPLADYHAEIVIAAAVVLASLPNLQGARVLTIPTIAIAGLSGAVFVSLLFSGWLGAAPRGLYSFLPCIFGYFLIVLNCKTIAHLRLVVFALFIVSAVVISQGLWAIHQNAIDSPYLYDQANGDGSHTPRLRGLSFINDPNDFSQVVVSLIPLMFFFRRPARAMWNLLLVWVPVIMLTVGLFLAHSRGAAVALMAVILLGIRKRIGTLPALLISGAFFAGTSALSWSGGREMSVEAGSDRLDAWSTGLQLIKTHPLIGVGYERFSEYYYITAHNSIVVCAAELGIIGFFFWVLFAFTTLRTGVSIAESGQRYALNESASVGFSRPSSASSTALPNPTLESRRTAWMRQGSHELERTNGDADAALVARLAGLLVICLCGYLVAGWFLSRAYVMTLFLYGGMMQVLLRLATDGGFAPEPTSRLRLLRWTAYISTFLLAAVYVVLRLRNVLGK